MKIIIREIKNILVVTKGRGLEDGWSGKLGSADASFYRENE